MSRSIKKGPYVEEALMKKLKDDSSDNAAAGMVCRSTLRRFCRL